jgi:hypothetical protein
MKTIVYIGNAGNSARIVGAAVRALGIKFDANVIGMTLSQAYKNRAKLAKLAPESTVVTHSVGILALKAIVPKELIAIAPPMPVLPALLLLRSIPKAATLIVSGRESPERSWKVASYNATSLSEHLLRPRYNRMLLKEISLFNTAQCAVEMKCKGAKVTLVFMENDKYFPDSYLHPHVEIAEQQGVRINTVAGHHDEFALYPFEILNQLDG